jgi:hypothetical protein
VDGKRSKLGQSVLLMNTYFNQHGLDTWDEDAIRTRALALFNAAVLVWARPVTDAATPDAVLAQLSGSDAKQAAEAGSA